MKPLNNETAVLAYNKSVQDAYFKILKETRKQLATLEREELRYCLEREDRTTTKPNTVIHEIVNPLVYLRLECKPDNRFAIHFGFEQVLSINQYSQLTTFFIRLLYRVTSKEATVVNVEDAVRTDWIITTCENMYEYIEENNKYHQFRLIKHKPAAMKRKQLKAVA
ncbi:hypothetical protein HDF19_08440 [Mucilaginibacter sp. E4BP6]|uniref:hypothetical protein n=1 Tax=Mucilaginibacter sp. E4BP6 TaxID=2723089 RepID=UPI0015CD629E|nr:hypothetical protein [Mucilaginibacter sp. E4BP6]NYE68613.1 hypothetical protein [Mucilaginibacter sp. E4BP6]